MAVSDFPGNARVPRAISTAALDEFRSGNLRFYLHVPDEFFEGDTGEAIAVDSEDVCTLLESIVAPVS
jgi:hypothetical protein